MLEYEGVSRKRSLQRLQIRNTRTRYSSFRIDSIDRAMVLLLDAVFRSSALAARVGEDRGDLIWRELGKQNTLLSAKN